MKVRDLSERIKIMNPETEIMTVSESLWQVMRSINYDISQEINALKKSSMVYSFLRYSNYSLLLTESEIKTLGTDLYKLIYFYPTENLGMLVNRPTTYAHFTTQDNLEKILESGCVKVSEDSEGLLQADSGVYTYGPESLRKFCSVDVSKCRVIVGKTEDKCLRILDHVDSNKPIGEQIYFKDIILNGDELIFDDIQEYQKYVSEHYTIDDTLEYYKIGAFRDFIKEDVTADNLPKIIDRLREMSYDDIISKKVQPLLFKGRD